MAILPTFPAELIEKANALQLAMVGFLDDFGQASSAGQLSTEFVQEVSNVTAAATTALANLQSSTATTLYLDIAAQLDSLIDQVNRLGRALAQITGRPSRTAPYLDKFESSPLTTLLCFAIVGVGGYYLYKWMTKPDYYPRHKLPRYAGGFRAL